MEIQNQIKLIKVAYIGVLSIAFLLSMFSRGLEGLKNGIKSANVPFDSQTYNISIFEGLLLIIISFLSIRIFLYLYRFMNSVEKVEVFSWENIERLNLIGWYCIVLSFAIFFFNCLNLTHLSLNSIMEVDFEFWLLILGITLLTISFVFKKGIELKQENDLTI